VSTDDDGPRHRSGATFDDDIWFLERAQRLRWCCSTCTSRSSPKVHGYCLAGGTDIALLTDMVSPPTTPRSASRLARDLGVLPNHMWLYHCGPQWAKRLMLTGTRSPAGARPRSGSS
jgi:enoyl-CoA hydratase